MNVLFSLIFPVIILVVVGIIVAVLVANQRQVSRWRRWALARNWEFLEEFPAVVDAFEGGPFGRGRRRAADRAFFGRFDGIPVMGFDYQYETGSGDSETTHHLNVRALRIPGASFPRLDLSLENWASRTFTKDHQFEDAEFNRLWYVRSPSARFAHDVCHPRAIEFLKRPLPAFVDIWFENDCLLISSDGRGDNPDAVDAYLRLLTDFARLLPPFVLKEVGSDRLPLDQSGPGISQAEQARRIAELEAQEKQKR